MEKVVGDAVFMRAELKRLQEKHELIGDIRGIGLLWCLELVNDRKTKEKAVGEAEKVMYACLEQGLSFKVSAGNVLQLSPALTIAREELARALKLLDKSLSRLTKNEKN